MATVSGSRYGVALTWMTCAIDRTEHAITDEAFAAGRDVGGGRYLALCGRHVVSASMLSAPLSRCSACVRVVHLRNSLGTVEHRFNARVRHRKPSRLGCTVRRWFRT
jgi:hypothetical protein